MKSSRSEKNRTKLSEVIPIDTPYVVGFYTGDICNFKCKYCVHSLGGDIYNKNKDIIPKMMDWSIFTKAADALKYFSKPIKKILFSSMGEPLLNKKLPEMIKYVKDIGVASYCEIITNASLLTHELSEKLVDSGLDRLCVSIQGVTSQKYQEISQVNLNYDSIVKELSYFYQYSRGRCKVHIKTVDIALDDGEDSIFYNTFSKISDTVNIDSVIEAFQDVDYSNMIKDTSKGLYGDKQRYRLVCPSVFYTMYILPNGDVVTCCNPPYPIILGNIINDDLLNMWNGQKRLNLLKMQLEGRRMMHPICKGCISPKATNFKEDDLDKDREKLLNHFMQI